MRAAVFQRLTLARQFGATPVLDFTVSLAEVGSGYSVMDQRQAIKALVRP